MPNARCAKPSAMAVGRNGTALFAADDTPSSTMAVPVPEGSAKRIDEPVQGRVCACSTFDVHVLSGGGAERETEGAESDQPRYGKPAK